MQTYLSNKLVIYFSILCDLINMINVSSDGSYGYGLYHCDMFSLVFLIVLVGFLNIIYSI